MGGKSESDSESDIFYYHPDHLGSTAMVTDLDGHFTQNVVYIPFGEVFVEERNGKWNTPYLFNAKELDEETGLYYYGARYLDPTSAQWLSVDPLWEDNAGVSPFNYCLSNPIKMIDPDGMWQQDADGNWIAEKGDNAYSLAKALKINPSEAIGLLKEQGYEFSEGDKKVFLNIGDKVSPKNNFEKLNLVFNYPESDALEDASLFPLLDPVFDKLQDWTVSILQQIGCNEENSCRLAAGLFLCVSVSKGGGKVSARLPTQIHHFASNKSSRWTPLFNKIVKTYGLNLNGNWNKAPLPHLGRHPDTYHNFVLNGMKAAQREAGSDKDLFLLKFDQYVKQPIIQNPQLLRKSGWKQ